MEFWVTIITAVIGGAGVSGLLGGLVQFSRLSRSARLIDHLTKAMKDIPVGPAANALHVAVERERLRLTSIAMVRMPPVKWVVTQLVSVSGTVGLTLGVAWLTDPRGPEAFADRLARPETIFNLVGAALVFLIVLALFADYRLQRTRTMFVLAAEEPGADAAALLRGVLDRETATRRAIWRFLDSPTFVTAHAAVSAVARVVTRPKEPGQEPPQSRPHPR
jgi:hypothetical protein